MNMGDFLAALGIAKVPTIGMNADGSVAGLSIAGSVTKLARDNTFVMFGDSITAETWSGASGVTLVRSGNVVTATYNGHPFMTGQIARIEQFANTTFNGVFTVTRTRTNTFTYPCEGVDASTSGGYVRVPYWMPDKAWETWARFRLKNRLRVLYNAAIGGDTTGNMLARVQADVISRAPSWVSLMGGINDINSLTDVQIFANLQAIYVKLRDAGIRIVAHTILPLETGHAYYSTANNQKIVSINHMIRQECLCMPNMVLCDSYAAVVDPVSSTGQPKTGYLQADHIHPSARGAEAIGTAFANAVAAFIPAVNTLVASASDNKGANSSNTNYWLWLPYTPSTGSVAGGATGTPPGGFRVTISTGSPTVVASSVARTVATDGDAIGYNCRVVFTSAAANNKVTIDCANGSGWTSGMSVGKAYYFELSVNVTGVSGSNLSAFYAGLTFVVDGVNYPVYAMQPSGTSYPQNDFQGVLQTVPFFLTGTSATNMVISIVAVASAAGTPVTIDVGRVQVREVAAGTVLPF
jgi:acyl-CoA thioesterase I